MSKFLSARKQLAITAFTEAIHSCFKDGLNGTTDYRALAGLPLLALMPFGYLNHHVASLVGFLGPIITVFQLVSIACLISFLKPCKHRIANISVIVHITLFLVIYFVSYLWTNDFSVGTFTLEVTFISTGLASHLLVALWVSYNFTKLVVKKLKVQSCGHGTIMHSLISVLESIRDIFRRHRNYKELQEQ